MDHKQYTQLNNILHMQTVLINKLKYGEALNPLMIMKL